MTSRVTNKEVIEEKISKLHNDEYKLISDYNGTSKPITLLHKPCGTQYTVSKANRFLNEGHSMCPVCHKPKSHSTRRLTLKIFLENKSKEPDGNEYEYINGFKNSNTKLTLLHKTCGNKFDITPHMFLGSYKRRCPYCANKSRGQFKDNYLDTILKESNEKGKYEWQIDTSSYQYDNKKKLSIKHLECGNIYEVRPNDFQQGYRCPFCSVSKGYSVEEKEMTDYIKTLVGEDEVLENYREKIELDCYLPNYNLGFEFNGVYWHSDIYKDKNYHLNKLKAFLKKGIDVIFINESDWVYKRSLVEDRIRIIIGKIKHRIFARKTQFKAISASMSKKFLNENHLQGNAISKYNYGLFYKNELVSVMTFIGSRANVNSSKDDNNLELLRFASLKNHIIVGGFSKLLNDSLKEINKLNSYNKLITFADLSFSRGNVYLKNGFVLDHISKPSYNYFTGNSRRINRYQMRKSELKKKYPDFYNENLTELKIVDNIPNIYRVWNCGNLVLTKNLLPSK